MPRRKRVQQERQKVLRITEKNLFSEIIVLGKPLLLAPATNTICERSCSSLRRIKTYLRSTITQSRLSHCMMLNPHKEALGELNLIEIANEFCRKNEVRLNIFWKLSQEQIPQHLVSGNTDFLAYFIVFYFWLFLWQSTTIKLYELLEGLFTHLQHLK